jgi:hypothetical protein
MAIVALAVGMIRVLIELPVHLEPIFFVMARRYAFFSMAILTLKDRRVLSAGIVATQAELHCRTPRNLVIPLLAVDDRGVAYDAFDFAFLEVEIVGYDKVAAGGYVSPANVTFLADLTLGVVLRSNRDLIVAGDVLRSLTDLGGNTYGKP